MAGGFVSGVDWIGYAVGKGNLLVRTVVYVADAAMLPPIPNPSTEDWGCAEVRMGLVVVTAEIPKVVVFSDDVAAALSRAVVEPDSVVPVLIAEWVMRTTWTQ